VGKFWHRQIQAFCNQHAAFNVVNLSAWKRSNMPQPINTSKIVY
jgi:hypothetical protein